MYIDYQDGSVVSRKLVNKNTIDAKANKADIAATIYQGTATQNVTYWKVSNFGNWGTGDWYAKGFSMLLTSRAGEMIWVSLAANDSATSAEAIRLFNRYSKMASISYSASESAIYITAAGWSNNICAHILSNINGDYVPTISQASALPADAVMIPITEMGPTADQLNIGCSGSKKLNLTGSTDRPLYNSVDLALKSDVDTHTSNKSNPHGVTLAQLGVNATATELNYVDGVTSAIQTQLNGKVSKSGDTMTGSLTIGEGRDLCLQATAGSEDSGDIIFRNGSGVEIGKVWMSDSALSFRNSESAPISKVLHTQNYATHLDSRYVNTAGDTMTGTLKIKSGDSGDWTEGIRIAPANNGWTSLVLGSDAVSGTGTGVWSLHTYNNNFYLSHNGSSNGSPMITGIPNNGFNINGTLNLANGTWNKVGDDAYFGDNNTAGSFAIKGQNGYTNLKLVSNGGDSSCSYITYNQDLQCLDFSFG